MFRIQVATVLKSNSGADQGQCYDELFVERVCEVFLEANESSYNETKVNVVDRIQQGKIFSRVPPLSGYRGRF